MYVQRSGHTVSVHNYTVDPAKTKRVRYPNGKYSVEYPMGKGAVKENLLEEISKAFKTEDGIEYPSSAFAYVPDETKPSTWKLRLWDDLEAKETPAQVSRAIQAITTGFRGNKAQIPVEDMPKVISAIRTAWNKVHTAEDEKPAILKALEKSLGF